MKILELLIEKPMSWSELKEKTGLSHTVLSKYLKHLREEGLIARDEVTRKYYASLPLWRREEKMLSSLSEEYKKLLLYLRRYEDPKVRREVYHAYGEIIKTQLMMLFSAITAILRYSLGGKGPYKFEPEDLKDKEESIEKHIEQLIKDAHEVLEQEIKTWITPWLANLLDFCLIFSSSSKHILSREEFSLLSLAVKRREELEKKRKEVESWS